jgi:zinc protease
VDYIVLISKATHVDADWLGVADRLADKHGGEVIAFDSSPIELKKRLAGADAPRWLCWVARPQELGALPVAMMHRLARGLDDDPYPDCRWGIVTGRDAAVAMKVVDEEHPLLVRNVGASTSLASGCVERGRWFSEFTAGEQWIWNPGEGVHKVKGETDSTASIIGFLNEEKPDAFITSVQATEHDWQPGYKYRNGTFGHRDGALLGRALDGSEHVVDSPNTKVYLAVGNCLIGNIPATDDCMALAWIGSAGVRQMIGYTVPTWFGYAGWGVLDYFVEQPGRFTLQDAWLVNQHALAWKLGRMNPKLLAEEPAPGTIRGSGDAAGLLHDRDVTVFYGDPKWDARMAAGPLRWNEEIVESPPGEFTWTITPQAGRETFAPVDTNGSQRGGRPLVLLLPQRFGKLEMLEGGQWNPVLGDDFVLVPNPGGDRADGMGPASWLYFVLVPNPGGDREPPARMVIRFKVD